MIYNFFLFFFSFFIFSYYTSAVLTGLILPSSKTIGSADELLSTGMRLGVADFPFFRDDKSENAMYGPHSPQRDKLFKKHAQENNKYYNMHEALKKVMKGNFIIYTEEHTILMAYDEMLTNHEMCSIHKIKFVPRYPVTIVNRKNSPYSEFIRYNMVGMLEKGLQQHTVQRWLLSSAHCEWSQEAISIGMKAVSTALAVLICGMFACLTILSLEICLFRLSNNNTFILTS